MSVSENENFMSRWSRRKQEVDLESQAEATEQSDVSTEEEIPEKTPEEIREEKLAELNALTDEDMPDVETLDEDSDYEGFMSINVSEGLRKIALQKLFHGKSYNIRDGLDEYDGDYTFFEKLDPSVITADMKHMIGVEAKKLLAKEEQEALDLANLDSDVEEMDDEDIASDESISEEEMASGDDDSESIPVEELASAETQTVENHYLDIQDQEKTINDKVTNHKSVINNGVTNKDIA